MAVSVRLLMGTGEENPSFMESLKHANWINNLHISPHFGHSLAMGLDIIILI